uniref:Uncharacterized protein n=1 Tax=Chelonoidis abingdonii TaxID=106734 RepID=A0A8C0G998_CHEAB
IPNSPQPLFSPHFKAGGRRVSKKEENGVVEKNSKNPGKENTSSIATPLCSSIPWLETLNVALPNLSAFEEVAFLAGA